MESTSQRRVSLPDLPPSLRCEGRALGSATEDAIGFRRTRDPIGDLAAPGGGRDSFLRFLADLGFSDRLPAEDLVGIPRSGPVLLVATRPCGPVEGLLLGAILRTQRRDVRFLANHRLPEVRGGLLFVDPFGGREALSRLGAPLRQAIRWLERGGLLVLFPSGEGFAQSAETDLVLRWTQARAVPVYFAGPNGPLLRAVGRLHQRLRAAPAREPAATPSGSA
ncbi:MAG: hypothetical protein L0323_04490 [Planctomycetes bacterium]|nr:hypothetical protein [Planctomycetota bacterium]